MGSFIQDGAAVLPPVKSDARAPTGATTEWAAGDANELRSAALDLRGSLLNEISNRLAGDAAIVASGVTPSNVNLAPVTATGSLTARTIANRFADVANVLDFGADPTGVADSTAAIQAAITASITPGDPTAVVRTGIRAVYIPAGDYRIDSGLSVRGVNYFEMYGDGPRTRLLAGAPISGALLELDGVAHSSFRGFSISYTGTEATNTFDYGIWVRKSASTVRSTTALRFDDIQILYGKWKAAIAIGEPGSQIQIDTTTWTGIVILGSWAAGDTTWWQSGVSVGSSTFGNNLCHFFYGLEASTVRYPLNLLGTGVSLIGGVLQQGETDINISTSQGGPITVGNVRSEGSVRLLASGYATTAAVVSVFDYVFNMSAAMSTTDTITIQNAGAYHFRNVYFAGDGVTTFSPKIANGNAKALVSFDGLVLSGNSTLTSFLSVFYAPIKIGSVSECNAANVVQRIRRFGWDEMSDDNSATATLVVAVNSADRVQVWRSSFTTASLVVFDTLGAAKGDRFKCVRTGLGTGTLNVGGLATIPAATAGFAEVMFDGSAWQLVAYGEF